MLPVLLKWHHPILLLSWNASITLFFIPGQPKLWILMAGVSLGLSVLAHVLNKRVVLLNVSSVTWTLLAFVMVVFVTMEFRGGLGLRSMGGSTYGGKKYVLIFAAAIGYFAISSHKIPREKAIRYVALFLLGSLTYAISNLIYTIGDKAYWLFLVFPAEYAAGQAVAEYDLNAIARLSGLSFAMVGAYNFLLARYGIRQIFSFHRFHLFVLWVLILAASLWGGFRSILILYFIVFVILFYLERLYRTRLLPILVVMGSLCLVGLVPFASHMPFSVQRTLSFLPIKVDPVARQDARTSTEWRLQMWQLVWPQVPDYLWLGKGYVLNPTDLYLVQESVKRSLAENYQISMEAGDYHSGPLSTIITFGLFGLLSFIIFNIAGFRLVYCNFLYGDPELKRINTFLLAYFVAQNLFFWLIFGDIGTGLANFTGILGLSVALNGGIKQRQAAVAPAVAEPAPERQLAVVPV